jgi:integrase
MPALPHLQRSRHGVYYFRIVIPRAVRTYAGLRQRELKLSLHTTDRDIAILQARALRVKMDQLFQRLGGAMPKPYPVEPAKFDLDFDPATGRVKAINIRPGEEKIAVQAMIDANQGIAPLPAAQAAPPGAHQLADAPLAEVVERYLQWYKQHVAFDTHKKRASILKVFAEYFNNCKISDIRRAQLSDYWEDLPYFPKQKDLRPEYRDTKLGAILAEQKRRAAANLPYGGLSPQTQAHYREAVSGLYGWAYDKEIVSENLAQRRGRRVQSYRNEVDNAARDIYTSHDLKRIFEHDLYHQAQYRHPYQYWVPHIALFTGARINEIAQLYVDDIKEYDGHLAFEFCRVDGDEDVGGKRVRRPDIKKKNEASRRLTPVHPKLLELGLREFVAAMRAAKSERLFPELPYAQKGGYGVRVSRWYNEEFLRPQVGITNPSKVFHSFRHTVITALGNMLFERAEGVMVRDKDLIIKAIVGHKMQGMTFGRYLTEFHPKVTSFVLNPLDWQLDLVPYCAPKKAPQRQPRANKAAAPSGEAIEMLKLPELKC